MYHVCMYVQYVYVRTYVDTSGHRPLSHTEGHTESCYSAKPIWRVATVASNGDRASRSCTEQYTIHVTQPWVRYWWSGGRGPRQRWKKHTSSTRVRDCYTHDADTAEKLSAAYPATTTLPSVLWLPSATIPAVPAPPPPSIPFTSASAVLPTAAPCST